jgi:hypothetical protein
VFYFLFALGTPEVQKIRFYLCAGIHQAASVLAPQAFNLPVVLTGSLPLPDPYGTVAERVSHCLCCIITNEERLHRAIQCFSLADKAGRGALNHAAILYLMNGYSIVKLHKRTLSISDNCSNQSFGAFVKSLHYFHC